MRKLTLFSQLEEHEFYLTASVFAIYTFQGFLLIIFNGAVQITLAKHRHLRHRYIILLAQVSADTSIGFGLCSAGIGRLLMLMNGSYQMSRRYCLLLPWTMIGIWAEPLSAVATLMVSTDRLVAIALPMRYFRHYYSYQMKEIIIYFGSVWVFALVGWISSFQDAKTMLSSLCWTGDVLKPFYANIIVLVMITSSSLSVLLYAAVFYLTRKHVTRIKKNQMDKASVHVFVLRQRKLTVTMGISCLFTLIFYVFPICLKYFITDDDANPNTSYSDIIRIGAAISCNLNPLTNVAAVLIRHEDIASCLVRLFPGYIQKCFARNARPLNVPTSDQRNTCITRSANKFRNYGRMTKTLHTATAVRQIEQNAF